MRTNDQQYRLTVLLVTYNHEKYIHQALQSLLGQMIDGPIELIVADDGSSDNTIDIIKGYEGKDSRFHFKYLDNTSNLGITRNYQRSFAACTGEYVAIIEGDDYWITPDKLRLQIDFLQYHWECNLCSANYFVFEEDNGRFSARTTIEDGYMLISARELITDNLAGNFSTCLYRRSALDSLPPALFEIVSYDWIVNICVARNSLIGFLKKPMSVYRLHMAGVWTQTPHIKKIQTQLDHIPAYDKLTEHLFHNEFEALACSLRYTIKVSNVSRTASVCARPIAVALSRVPDYLPPILILIAQAIIPQKLKRFFVRVLNGSQP